MVSGFLEGLFLLLFRSQERDNVYHASTPHIIMGAQRTIYIYIYFFFFSFNFSFCRFFEIGLFQIN